MVFAGTGVWKSKRGAPLLGCRCVFINDEQYGYNVRDELISANEVSYAYEDIGNRTTAEGKAYTANNLNQYTAIDDFAPEYDADGNQTLIKTETGTWSVVYNAENRPIRWQSGDTVITMSFDRMGRRIEMHTVKDGEETLQRFVYDNYLCIQQLRGADNALFQSYVWDPTEPIATRPLVFLPAASSPFYYVHDGNKNVSDLVDIHGSVIHYDYTPFGTSTPFATSENPFGFSSEFYDKQLALVYYNYRHYSPISGHWMGRDLILQPTSPYNFLRNKAPFLVDYLGNLILYSYYDNLTLREIFLLTGGLSARTGDSDLTKTNIPIFKENKPAQIVESDGGCCAEVAEAGSFYISLATHVPTRSSAVGVEYSERGWSEMVAHEERRVTAYRYADAAIVEGIPKVQTKCGSICTRTPGLAMILLDKYLQDVLAAAMAMYIQYLEAELGAIGDETWIMTNMLLQNGTNGPVKDHYREVHQVRPVNMDNMIWPPCPQSQN